MRFAVKLIEVVRAVAETRFYRYIAISDNKTCECCQAYDGRLFTEAEMRDEFPYLQQRDQYVFYPRVHPNCRCVLRFEEEI